MRLLVASALRILHHRGILLVQGSRKEDAGRAPASADHKRNCFLFVLALAGRPKAEPLYHHAFFPNHFGFGPPFLPPLMQEEINTGKFSKPPPQQTTLLYPRRPRPI